MEFLLEKIEKELDPMLRRDCWSWPKSTSDCHVCSSPGVERLLMRRATQAEKQEFEVPQFILGYAFRVAFYATHWDLASREAFAF